MKTVLAVISLFPWICSFSQQDNPFRSIGKEDKILTLSKGKYSEVYYNDTLQKIGSVIINTKSGAIYEFLDSDTLYNESNLNPTVISRWYSPDPIVKSHESPYASFSNNPIWFTDPNGADTVNYNSAMKSAGFQGSAKEAGLSQTFNSFLTRFASGDLNGLSMRFKSVANLKSSPVGDDPGGVDAAGQSRLMYKGQSLMNLKAIPKDAKLSDFEILVELNSTTGTGRGTEMKAEKTNTLVHELLLHSNTQANFLMNASTANDKGEISIDGPSLLQAYQSFYGEDKDHGNLYSGKAALYNAAESEIIAAVKFNGMKAGFTPASFSNYPSRKGTNNTGTLMYWEVLFQVFQNDRTPPPNLSGQ